MRRKPLLLASAALVVAFAGCRHRCHKKDDCCGGGLPPIPPGARTPINLPPPGVPTSPGPSVLPPASSGFLPPSSVTPPPPKGSGPEVLFPEALPGSSSARPTQPGVPGVPGVLGAPVKPATAEPPKARAATGLPGYTKVANGLFAGAKPALDGFDSLKAAGFRTAIYLHAPGADVAAVRDMASTRDLNFTAIETTPETLADASKEFDRVAADRLTRPAYVFGDDPLRAGAVWYLHFRGTGEGDDVARLRARALGLSDQGAEGKAFAVAIQKVLEAK